MEIRFCVELERMEGFIISSWVPCRAVGTGGIEVVADVADIELQTMGSGQLVVRRVDLVRDSERRRREDIALRGADHVGRE